MIQSTQVTSTYVYTGYIYLTLIKSSLKSIKLDIYCMWANSIREVTTDAYRVDMISREFAAKKQKQNIIMRRKVNF